LVKFPQSKCFASAIYQRIISLGAGTNVAVNDLFFGGVLMSEVGTRQITETNPGWFATRRDGDVVLRDGSTVRVRVMRPEDEELLFTLFKSLSADSRWLRFMSAASDSALAAEAHREASVDYCRKFGLIALTGAEDRVVGHAFYTSISEDRAEVAFAIADDYQRRGLATILLGQLAEVAAANSIQVFEAETLSSNTAMLNVFRESGFPTKITLTAGELLVRFPTSLTPEAIEKFERRDSVASENALKLFFKPRAVAVIGASRKRGSIGGEIFHNLLSYGFQGPVYPVNPSAKVIQCVRAYKTVEDIPDAIDLAIIVVPATEVVAAAESCGRKSVKALVVISAGFSEIGAEGQDGQSELLRVCRAYGMRLIGPNCMGILNTDSEVRLDATFAPTVPPSGRVGFSSQSGALGLAIMEYANSLGLGISTFVSVGNKADISGNDLLRYWENDDATEVILLYLESFGNPRKFSQIARRVGKKKPIVVVKSGRSKAGARATSSHTGALIAASDITVDALFRQSGVIRTDTLEELFDVATLLANQPLPPGRRVGIITNAGGPAILCADACEARGLEVPLLTEVSQQKLRTVLKREASVANPVDMIASATAEQYREAIRTVGSDPNIDSLIVIFVPPLVTHVEDVAQVISEEVAALNRRKPLASVLMSPLKPPAALTTARVPVYQFPETAAIAMARAARYGEWRQRPEPARAEFVEIRRENAAAIVATALQRGEGWLTPEEVAALLDCYGLRMVDQRFVKTPDEAADAAGELGCPVALKVIAPNVLHKTEAGGVRLKLRDPHKVRAAANEMFMSLESQGRQPTGFIVQRMAQTGVEMILGVVHDPQFGPVVACGAGGTQVELLRDVAVRLTPISKSEASEMIRALKTYPLLDGFRGGKKFDVEALEDALLRVSALVDDIPQIAELDCNPFVVTEQGGEILDARVRVASVEPRPLIGVRR
jgi:acetyl coenzyme A synthetase (ADP forming)-like protein